MHLRKILKLAFINIYNVSCKTTNEPKTSQTTQKRAKPPKNEPKNEPNNLLILNLLG